MIISALIFFLGRHKTMGRGNTANSDSVHAASGLTPKEFETAVTQAFKRQGFDVRRLGRPGVDGGVELALTRNGELYFAQCRHWRAHQVREPVVRELYGLMAAEGARGGYVVTAGRFARDARMFADGIAIELIDGTGLSALLHDAKNTDAGSGAVASDVGSRVVTGQRDNVGIAA